ncbi:MAG: HAMP domain-containing sensor histidine kinase [Clostridium septicum]|uniref:sensor histidine kinase n=1 Tax=Clostridium septicum TaxID=1504 RepID=UPI002582E965|nr:HAMP domain-containing sensor histidine kinase [Clostridium septicum]MDU1313097.1 HAMP domain-containing sensor histidine kinase [Clostridium septicum]
MRIRNKKRKTGSFFSLLAKNQIIFIVAFLAVAALLYGMTTLYTTNLYYEPKFMKLTKEIKNFQKEHYNNISLYKYLGKNFEMTVFNEKGKKIYSTAKNKFFTFSLDELDCIRNIEDEHFYSVSQYQTAGGIKRLIMRFDDVVPRDSYSNAYGVIDENLYVTEGNLFPRGKIFTEKKLQIYMGKYNNFDVRKMKFRTESGELRYAVFMVKSMDYKKYDQLILIWASSWISFILAYILMIILSMIWLSKRTKGLLDPLNTAILEYMNKKNTYLQDYSGPNEFVEIADNFSALAERLDESETERERLDKCRQKMLADISHDLKTPITVIQGYSRAVRDGLVPENERERYLNTICKKAETLSELIDTFSEYSKLEHPDFSLKIQEEDICEFCKELLADKYQELEFAGYILEVDIPDNSIYYKFDPSHMKRVIDNIIGNSIKYNPPGTSLYFSLCNEVNNVQIMLGDNGFGISEEIAKTLFNPFVIGDESRSSKQGTGLGLAIAREIVEKHGGKICLVQNPILPYKTQFLITLPKI